MFLLRVILICLLVLVPDFAEAAKKSRKKAKSVTTTTATAAKTKQPYQCAGKTKCAQMNSCAEAQFYLKVCGVHRLDRDKDGVACETLC